MPNSVCFLNNNLSPKYCVAYGILLAALRDYPDMTLGVGRKCLCSVYAGLLEFKIP